MTTREIFRALAVFLALALILGAGTEIVSTPSQYDEDFFVTKSVMMFGKWLNTEAVKEIGSPLFFALVRSVSIPLRVAFGLGYALSLFLLWWELRRWAFPPVACWLATLLPMFAPAQFKVFSEPTADPLLVVLWVCQLVTCLALCRRGANWICTILAGLVAVMTWLDRPEGILSVVSVILIIALAVIKKRAGGGKTLPALVSRIAAVAAMQAIAMTATVALNWHYYGLPASTMMKDADFRRALRLFMAIDDGEPVRPYRAVSKRAMELAIANSPAVAKVRSYWENNYDRKGWSATASSGYDSRGRPVGRFAGYDPGDGSVNTAYFQWAFRDSMLVAAGGNVGDELRYAKQVGDELQGAMDRGALHKRFVLSSVLGPSANPFSARYWRAFFKVGRAFAAGSAPITPPVDTATPEQNRKYDTACSRRSALIFKSMVHIRGWIVMETPPHVPESISIAGTGPDVSFSVVSRPDVVQTLFGGQTDPAWCGFAMDGPEEMVREATLIVDGNGTHERLVVSQWGGKQGLTTVQGQVRFHLDELSDAVENASGPSRRWDVMNKCGIALSRCMPVAGVLSLAAFAGILFGMKREAAWRKIRADFLIASLVTALIVLPRWGLFAAFEAFVFCGVVPRYVMPFTALAWTWEGLALGIMMMFIAGKIRRKTIGRRRAD